MNIYETFVTVVKLGSFSAAAKSLHRSPSSISKKMSQLEDNLNTQLFDRSTRDLSVTEAGKKYFERCVEISKLINEAESELNDLTGSQSGLLKLTWPNSISSSSIVDTVQRFSEAYPEITLDIKVANEHINLIDENIDFAFRMDPKTDSAMIAIELMQPKPVICASKTLIKKYGNIKGIEDLSRLPLLLLDNNAAIQNFWKSLPGFENLNIVNHHRINDINALCQMVVKGFGASLLFEHMISAELSDGSLVRLAPELQLPSQSVYLMYNPLNYKTKQQSLFIDFFKDYYLRST